MCACSSFSGKIRRKKWQTTNKNLNIKARIWIENLNIKHFLSPRMVRWSFFVSCKVASLQWISNCSSWNRDYCSHEAIEKESTLSPSNTFPYAQTNVCLWLMANLKDRSHNEEPYNCNRCLETEMLGLQEHVRPEPCHFTGQMHWRELRWVITEVRMAFRVLPSSRNCAVI